MNRKKRWFNVKYCIKQQVIAFLDNLADHKKRLKKLPHYNNRLMLGQGYRQRLGKMVRRCFGSTKLFHVNTVKDS